MTPGAEVIARIAPGSVAGGAVICAVYGLIVVAVLVFRGPPAALAALLLMLVLMAKSGGLDILPTLYAGAVHRRRAIRIEDGQLSAVRAIGALGSLPLSELEHVSFDPLALGLLGRSYPAIVLTATDGRRWTLRVDRLDRPPEAIIEHILTRRALWRQAQGLR